jgi:hypothetical protein
MGIFRRGWRDLIIAALLIRPPAPKSDHEQNLRL